jgi:hypothetical protein
LPRSIQPLKSPASNPALIMSARAPEPIDDVKLASTASANSRIIAVPHKPRSPATACAGSIERVKLSELQSSDMVNSSPKLDEGASQREARTLARCGPAPQFSCTQRAANQCTILAAGPSHPDGPVRRGGPWLLPGAAMAIERKSCRRRALTSLAMHAGGTGSSKPATQSYPA